MIIATPPAGFHLPPMEFGTPQALWLLLVLPVWWVLRIIRRPPTITFSRADLIAQGPKTGSWYPKILFVLRNLIIIGLVLTVARLRIPEKSQNVTKQGINIMLAVDLSSSMLAQDFQPNNRIAVAKASVRDFILARENDQIGLVAFASEAVTQVPLTTQYPVLLQAVDNLQVGQLDDGTAIGDGIITAARGLYKAPGKSRVIILLTDGVNNRGAVDPLTAAKAAITYGIKIYTIGVGTRGMALVPMSIDSVTGKPHFSMQKVDVDEALLTQVAEMSGGQYFRAVNSASLQDIYQQINTLERSPIQTTSYTHYRELFRWPLGIAIVLLLIELSIAAVRAPLP
ncbi:MAG TPA: VWA domain-containing protein [Gemmatimonadaceae bacterium]|jgi:Ca-activated chloride channel family protein|nr:VWA domain-containing protein [Gemmatimonadaceae bacterium]